MEGVLCKLCNKRISLGKDLYVDHKCGCYTHTACHIGLADKRPLCPLHAPSSDASKKINTLIEPKDMQGGDWIGRPPRGVSTIGHLWTTLTELNKQDIEDIKNPLTLLKKKTPIEYMIRDKQMGLVHMYDAGITLKNFLDCGYSIDELCVYEDIGKLGPERATSALQALGLTPDMLLDYPTLLPIKTMQTKFNLDAKTIASEQTGGGLYFHPTDGLRTKTTGPWSVDDIIKLGFKFSDLQEYCGLRTRDQWDSLNATNAHMKALKCTQRDIDGLVHDFIEDEEVVEKEPEKPKVAIKAKLKPYVPPPARRQVILKK
jgi:hypothetical protein